MLSAFLGSGALFTAAVLGSHAFMVTRTDSGQMEMGMPMSHVSVNVRDNTSSAVTVSELVVDKVRAEVQSQVTAEVEPSRQVEQQLDDIQKQASQITLQLAKDPESAMSLMDELRVRLYDGSISAHVRRVGNQQLDRLVEEYYTTTRYRDTLTEDQKQRSDTLIAQWTAQLTMWMAVVLPMIPTYLAWSNVSQLRIVGKVLIDNMADLTTIDSYWGPLNMVVQTLGKLINAIISAGADFEGNVAHIVAAMTALLVNIVSSIVVYKASPSTTINATFAPTSRRRSPRLAARAASKGAPKKK